MERIRKGNSGEGERRGSRRRTIKIVMRTMGRRKMLMWLVGGRESIRKGE